jgi:hypothetical protein
MASISRTVGFKVLGQSSYVQGSNPSLDLIWPNPSVIGDTDGMSLFLFHTANWIELMFKVSVKSLSVAQIS